MCVFLHLFFNGDEKEFAFQKMQFLAMSFTANFSDVIDYAAPRAILYPGFLAILPFPFGLALWAAASETNGAGGETAPRKSILIVEDNETNLKLLNDLLEFQGHQIYATASGLDAITIACETHPDLILLDLQLPDISGFEVAGRLKAGEATRASLSSR